MAGLLGADAVGMSTAIEAVAAGIWVWRVCGQFDFKYGSGFIRPVA